MRARLIATILLLAAVSTEAAAQRGFPFFGRRRGLAPAEMPRQPAAIARELAYRRSKLSVESYPMVTQVRAAGLLTPGVVTKWTSFGAGTRASYRLSSFASATFDMTSAPFNGVASTETAELGARVGPELWDHKVHPFVDARAGYARTFDGYFGSNGNAVFVSQQPSSGVRYGQGLGAVAGVGVDRSVSRMFSLTVAWSVMRSRLDAREGSVTPGSGGSDRYWMTAYRYTLGLRFNPVRAVDSTQRGAR